PKELGYLPQQTARQKDFPATVNEIVLSGCLSGPFYNKTHKKRALDAMERLGLVPLAKRSYRELSGGQQERVLLARALCTSGKMLLLDEPTAGLDPKITAELYELLSNLHQEGITLVMISHDMDAALRYATKILWLNENIFYGTKEEYLKKFPQ
ncbi:MAG: ATP-binding cassette domain-containing protein, partial [Eubacteriales bacterium]